MLRFKDRWIGLLGLLALVLMVLAPTLAFGQEATEAAEAVAEAVAEEAPATPEQLIGDVKMALDTIWVMVAGFMVFFMNLGFAMVESGLCRSKNTVNILAKNFIVFGIACLGYFFLGWGIMFGNGNAFFGTEGVFMLSGADNSPNVDAYVGAYSAISWAGIPLYAKFFFQLVFAATAATIVSGAVAERIKFGPFLVFSFILTALIYPVVGHMIWGGGYLGSMGMWDFAGSTTVHSTGGWAALAGVIALGPRLGKYRDGKINAIPGHSMTSATLGGLVLWFGWYGFNPGSTMAADGISIAHIAVTTTMAAAIATVTATATAWIVLGKPDLSMIINGTLAGLVGITAPCAFVSVGSSLIIGAVAGVLVVFAVLFFDRIRIDDPVGAISVHLVNGVWGTLAVGLFAQSQETYPWMPGSAGAPDGLFFGGGISPLITQLIGVVVAGAFTFVASIVVWYGLKAVMGIRVSAEEEAMGLDLGEHAQEAYPDFLRSPSRFEMDANYTPQSKPRTSSAPAGVSASPATAG